MLPRTMDEHLRHFCGVSFPSLPFYAGSTADPISALALATLGIFVRSVFRVAELSEGFGGHLANDEVSFMILDGTMVIISCLALTIVHPGRGFGSVWKEANFTFRTKNETLEMGWSGNEGSERSGSSKMQGRVTEVRV